jgi:hypothetical protein
VRKIFNAVVSEVRRVLLGCATTATLVGCSSSPSCVDQFTFDLSPAVNAAEQLTVTGQCVDRWSVRFAASQDTAESISEAVLEACQQEFLRYGYLIDPSPSQAELKIVTDQMRERFKPRSVLGILKSRSGDCSL